MGEVYVARDTRLNRTVAIKVSREQFSERFEREARAIAALNHPNICTLHDVGPNYLVMEFVEGPTLAERIAAGAMGLEEALRIARQIGDALEAAHEQGVVHRDLKPGNVKIKPDGLVKVLDFGLAKVGGAPAAHESQNSPTISMAATQAGVILGTAAYMAPEQARGKVVDKRADIWAFGVVLYEMVTGRQLFEGEDVTETLATVIKGEPKWDGVPASVQRLLKSCLEKDPKRRLRDIGDVWRLLDEAPGVTAPSGRGSVRRFGIVAGIVAAVAVVIASALAFVHFREKPPAAEVMRFQISPPAQGSFFGPGAFVSPDGRRLAFTLSGPDGHRQLWVRSLDSIESRSLADTDVFANFWSPDSRFLLFVLQGKLKKVDASGGPPQTVCDLPGQFRGAAWSRNGVIIFGAAGTGLWRVPAAGGTPLQLTRVDPSRQEVYHTSPAFLPDGRHFLYRRAGGEHDGIYLGSLDAKPEQQSSKRLAANESGPVYAPASEPGSSIGHVLFGREGSLMAQAFDIRRMELTGEAVPIAESVGGGPLAFSASMTGVLAYRTGTEGGDSQLTWFDREGKALGTAGEKGGNLGVALSRDGTRAAASYYRESTLTRATPYSSDIWLHEFARNTSTPFTSDPAPDAFPTWSPDGSRIIFSSPRGSAWDLYQKNSNGAGNEDLLFKSSDAKYAQDWSPDGRFLLYSGRWGGGVGGFGGDGDLDLWVLPLTPGNTRGNPADRKPEPYLKTGFSESQGKFSPDGRFVAYRSDASGRDEIYVRPFPVASGGMWPVSTGGGIQPRWRGDGKEILYISADSKMMAVEVSANPVFKAGIPKALFAVSVWAGASTRNVTRYDVTADGKKFLISVPLAAAGAPAPITVVLNWTALLKK
jgi:Tol biopolymer transport system component